MTQQGPVDRAADVVVIGYGAAGCAAAIAAADSGASVVVLEKMPPESAGGNTRVSGGIWFQGRDPETSARYLRSLCGDLVVPEPVVQTWAVETHVNTDWLRELGVDAAPHPTMFHEAEYPELEGSETYVAGMAVNGVMGEQLLWNDLTRLVAERSVDVMFGTRATRLLLDADRRVVGVEVEADGEHTRVVARRGVVLASGGFENAPDLVREHVGLAGASVWGSPAGTGDGLRMAQRIGAGLWHMTNRMATVGITTDEFGAGFPITFIGTWSYLWVGLDGRRFVDETLPSRHGHALINDNYEYRASKPTYVIFDQSALDAGPIGPARDKMAVGWNLLIEGYMWSEDNRAEIDRGWFARGDDARQLAGELGLDPERLAESIADYNEMCVSGAADPFQRPRATLVPLASGPLFGFRSAPVLGWTNGGVCHDERARVLDVDGAPIDGLFAAGTVSSTYSRCKDAGFHIADALAFGRVAGREAAASPLAG